ncbi:MAG: DNA-processing protein DprA [Desulfobacterales bacterium]|jgi:DNA processing protein
MDEMRKLLPWFCLKNVPGIGNHLFKRLLDRFKLPEMVFQAPKEELIQVEGISIRQAEAIQNFRTPDSVRRELDQINQKGHRVTTFADPDYPPLLREIPDPPPFLYVSGNLEGSPKNIAVVGSRNATGYGISTTQKLCADLCAFHINIVSGMAIGIDTAAHEGALAGRGKTVAVLGSGLEKIYPAENRNLFKRICESGAVITEFSLNTEPDAHHFPIRNRIISGMSIGTVVVEATKKSGSLITARLAAEQNREVFAVPGSIQSFKSTGTHTLIKQGAKLVENAQDVLEELTAFIDAPKQTKHEDQISRTESLSLLTPEELAVYKVLSPYPEHIDMIVRKTTIEPGKLLSILLQLELNGMVNQLPGKRFALN